jgi:hypothetical protein
VEIGRIERLGLCQTAERFGQPRPGDAGRPRFRVAGVRNRAAGVGRRARQHAHRVGERDAVAGGVLHRAPVTEHLLEPRAVELDPTSLDRNQPVGRGEQLADLAVAQWLTVDHEIHGEVEQRIEPDARRRFAADRHLHRRPPGGARLPPIRDAHDHARRLERRHVTQEPMRLGRAPRERMKHAAAVHELAQKRAVARRGLHRPQQRKQRRFVARARVLLERLAQRQVPRLAAGAEARRVAGEERERSVDLSFALGEMEVDAPDLVPYRVEGVQEFVHTAREVSKRGARCRLDFGPQRFDDVERQVLPAGHRRGRQNQRRHLVGGAANVERVAVFIQIWRRAQARHERRPDVAPERARRGQRARDLDCTEVEQPGAGAATERGAHALGRGDVDLALGHRSALDHHAATRREGQRTRAQIRARLGASAWACRTLGHAPSLVLVACDF